MLSQYILYLYQSYGIVISFIKIRAACTYYKSILVLYYPGISNGNYFITLKNEMEIYRCHFSWSHKIIIKVEKFLHVGTTLCILYQHLSFCESHLELGRSFSHWKEKNISGSYCILYCKGALVLSQTFGPGSLRQELNFLHYVRPLMKVLINNKSDSSSINQHVSKEYC